MLLIKFIKSKIAPIKIISKATAPKVPKGCSLMNRFSDRAVRCNRFGAGRSSSLKVDVEALILISYPWINPSKNLGDEVSPLS